MPGAAIGAFLGWMFTGWGSIGAMTTFLGMQMSVLSVIMLGASIGSLFDQVDLGDIGSTPNYAFGQLSNTKSQLLPVPIVYGKCKVAGNIFLQQYYDDTQTKLDMFVGISEGTVHSIKEIYANDVQLTDDSGTWVATTKTECSHNVHLGAADQTVDSREPDGVTNYGNTAYIALTLRADADLSGNPTITSIVEGREVWTPTGTMYTRNPAWCIYDFLTNARYGVGIPAGLIDLDSFETVAAYCDSSDGGEVRYTLDYIIDTQQPAIDHLQAMLSTFNGYFSCREKIELHCDMPVVAAYKSLDEDNFIKGSFSWWQKPDEDVCNRVVIEWVDPDNSYERVSASFPVVEDVADQTRRGVIEQKFTLLGVTRASQVGRLGQYLYDTGRLLRNFCSFGLSLQDADIDAGDVIEISYVSFTGWNKKKFRVLKIEDAGDDTIKCSCVEYDPDVFDNDAYVTPVITPDTPPVNHDDVYGLTLTDVGHVNDDGTWVPVVRAEWQNPSSFTPSSIRVYYQHNTETEGDDEAFILATESAALITQYDIAGLQTDQTYTIKITCMKTGAETTGVSAQIVVGKDTTPPGAVTGLTALGWFGSIWLNWINPVDPDWHHTEIWENTIDQRDGEGGAVKIADVAGTSYQRMLGSFEGRYYWARAVDMSGNIGPWNAAAGVYGYSEQESHQDFVDELISNSPYLQEAITDLNTPIASLEGSVTDLLADVGDIQGYVSGVIADLHGIKDIEIPDVDSRIARAADRADELIGDALLRLQIAQRDTRALVRDAGIVVDPESGKVVISALESLKLESGLQMSDVNALFDAQDAKIELKASRTYVDTLAQEIMNGFAPTYAYEYNGTAEGWTADAGTTLTQGASSVVLETTTSATWTSPDIEFTGADNPTCTVRIRRTDGETWGVALQWKTAELPYSTERQLAVTEPSMPGNWNSLQVRTSSDAWDAATVTGIRFIFSDATKYEIDSISVGKSMLQELLFEDLELRITQAEIDIDGALASITLKADSTELNALGARITQAEIDIDGVEGSIGLMATKTELEDMGDDVEARFTSVGLELNAAKGLIAQEVIAAQSVYGDTEAAAQALLRGLLFGQGQFGKVKQNLAYAREQLTATINDKLEAEAAYRLTLAAQIDDNTAAIRNESTARATADEAMASQIMSMGATVEQNSALIETEMTIRADAISAEATARQTLAATVSSNTSAIQTEATTRANADSAEATARQTLAAVVGTPLVSGQSVFAAIQNEQTVRATADSANASSISTLQTTVGGHTSSISTLNSSVNGIKSKHAVKIDTNGYVTGYELIGGADEGSMVFHVDNFLIGKPGTSSDYPFALGTVDGVTKVSMKNTFIQDAAISAAKIKDAAVGTLKIAGNAVSVMAAQSSTSTVEWTTDEYKTAAYVQPSLMAGFPVLIQFSCNVHVGECTAMVQLLRNGSVVGGQTDITIAQYGDSARFGAVYSYLDTAPSTGVVQYKIQMKRHGGLYLALYTRSLWALHTKR